MESDLNDSLFYDTQPEVASSPRLEEDLPPIPQPVPDPPVDEVERSPPHSAPAPYRSKLRPRRNTVPASLDVTVIEVKRRAQLAKKRLQENKKRSTPPVAGIVPISTESLEWDDEAHQLNSATDQSRLWSTSTQFSVTVSTPPYLVSTPSLIDVMDDDPATIADNASQATAESQSTSASTATGETMRPQVGPPPLVSQHADLNENTPPVSGDHPPPGATAPPPDHQHRAPRPPGPSGSHSDPGTTPHSSSESSRSTPPNDDPSLGADAAKWRTLAKTSMDRAKAYVLPYKGKRVPISVATSVRLRAEKLIDDLFDVAEHCGSPLREEVQQYISDMASICADLLDLGDEDDARSRHSSPPNSPTRPTSGVNNAAATALLFSRNRIEYLLERISDNNLADVQLGGDITPDRIRSIHDTQVSSVRGIVKECMDRTAKYAALPGADLELIETAQTQCQNAEKWCDLVVSRYRSAQLHLEGNMNSKEVTFKKFDPKGSISIYQFLSSYEDWCHGYISDSQKPRLLFTKYLHPSLTTSYEELKARRHDYGQMKSWLIDNFGSVKAVADNHLRAIRALKTPKATDDALTHAIYIREMHRLLTTLYNLEIRKGIRVPQLQEYITSHTFLLQIGEILPAKVKTDWTDSLAKEQAIIHKIEGERHLKKILDILKERYVSYELLAGISPGVPTSEGPSTRSHHAERANSPTPSVASSCASCGHDAAYAAGALPKRPARSSPDKKPKQPPPQSKSKPDSDSKTKLPRWSCPLRGHERHKFAECRIFFGLETSERRKRVRWACYTCFAPKGCSNECKNLASVPKVLLCPECGSADSSGKSSVNVLMCGVHNHTKPSSQDVADALEKWVPKFQVAKLAQPVNVGFTLLMAGAASNPPKSRSSRPDSSPTPVAFDTCSGTSKPLSKHDSVIKKSTEESFYVMQMLCIASEPVLTFYDTGSNAHLVDGAFAERAGFQVLDDSCTRIGVIGGDHIWSEYGVYSCILGPDADNRYHEIECQGLSRITSAFPEFDLRPLHREVYRSLPTTWQERLPESIGGDRVKLLIGIRSSSLAPIQRFSLPSGLGVFQSALIDVHGASICFGGPHEVFTKGYARSGVNANHLQVYFTEIAQAYMRSPHTFISRRCERTSKAREIASRETFTCLRPTKHLCPEPSEHDCQSELRCPWVHDECHYAADPSTDSQEDSECARFVPALSTDLPESYSSADNHHTASLCVGPPGGSDTPLSHTELMPLSEPRGLQDDALYTRAVPGWPDSVPSPHLMPRVSRLSDQPLTETRAPSAEPNSSRFLLTEALTHKALVPLSKLKGLLDEDDIPDVKETRCDTCANCPACRLSARAKTKSLQESYEQEVIEKSVVIDLAQKKVFVDLPFVRPPAEFLIRKHGRPDNFHQALRVYKAQCRKPDTVKDQVRTAQKDLQERGFMVPLSSLSVAEKNAIAAAPFRHYFPWRAVYKESTSTPVRMVVDPSATGLNIVLAKGVNMLPLIPDILVRLRVYREAWTTDISKLYNRLHLNSSSHPYSLFLFDDSLSDSVPPQIWLLNRAWYGVSSTGNQAGVALERLAQLQEAVYPNAVIPLTRDKYVDDIASGADTKPDRDIQIQETTQCLSTAGFSLKFIAKSGEPPPEGASADGQTVGCLGIAWQTQADTLSLAHQPMNLNKKVRGLKAAPDRDLSTAGEIRRAFQDGLISKAGVLSRIAEFYDPAGWWEPVKLQMKISFQELNPLSWEDQVPDDLIDTWVSHFTLIENTRSLTIPRCIIPSDCQSTKVRLICLSDAAEGAGGTAIYGGVRLPDGSYSCSLLLSKSKLMSHSIPRNELEAVVLMADAALTVRKSLGDRVESTFYFSDSTIAICWILNTTRKLRMFVHNRVQLIRQGIREVVDGEERIPLYHIDGESNLADMITKPRRVQAKDVGSDSPWICGLPWMRLPTDQLPSVQYGLPIRPEDEPLISRELFPDVSFHLAQVEAREILLGTPAVGQNLHNGSSYFHDNPHRPRLLWLCRYFDFIHLGWSRAYNRLKLVCRAMLLILHRKHPGYQEPVASCAACSNNLDARVVFLADAIISRTASSEVSRSIGPRQMEKQFTREGDVWYASQRLEKEGAITTRDLDFTCFYDSISIKKVLPVILVKSDLFHSLLLHIHFVELPHAGVEVTLARVKQRFYPVGHARRAITRLRESCTKCRLSLKRAVGIELADLHKSRTTIAPPFYSAMIDIAMGFKARPTKDSRKSFTVNAIVIVCLLTSATSIHVIEGLTTQSVVLALERHSSRYGVPAHLFVDSGTQLEKLQDTSFSLRDIQSWSSSGRTFTVSVSTPKAHQQQGRVEAKIRILREMLQTFSDTCELCNTILGWETIFAKISDHVDSLPIARGSSSAAYDLGWEIITPNRLKLGRNNFRQLDGDIQLSGGPQTMLERNRLLSEKWYQIFVDRIPLLVPKAEKPQGSSLSNGDVVLFLFQDPGIPKMWTWKLGIVTSQRSRATYEIRYISSPGSPPKFICRDLHHICLIHGIDEIPPMSRLFYERDEPASD
jgi:Pao retrotransposon peptidase